MEHIRTPRPQFAREGWLDLSGQWDFGFDDNNQGIQEEWMKKDNYSLKINVPFVYESELSGIHDQSYHPIVWYKKEMVIKKIESKRILFHIEGVDYLTQIYINGNQVGSNQGASTRMTCDITDFVQWDQLNRIDIRVQDSMSTLQPRGKQRWIHENFACWYLHSTGIWKRPWIEYVGDSYLEQVKMTPCFNQGKVRFEYKMNQQEQYDDLAILTKVLFKGRLINQVEVAVGRQHQCVEIDILDDQHPEKLHYWRVNNRCDINYQANLYDVIFEVRRAGNPIDKVSSYFGYRDISIEGNKVLLNGHPIYQRLILDQGYWKESLLTPPDEEALLKDIRYIIEAGYNGVRKHQKIEDERFLYWCDRLGLIVWSEMASTYEFYDEAINNFTKEWMGILEQYYNHPSILVWVPFNESWGVPSIKEDQKQQNFVNGIYHLTKAFDHMRPVITNDGWEHTLSDIITLHDYSQNGLKLDELYTQLGDKVDGSWTAANSKAIMADGFNYKGQPIILSEYGGIAFSKDDGWGYGDKVDSEEKFIHRFESLTKAIKNNNSFVGYCYTQITDVQQETNGLLTEERTQKVDINKIREINLYKRGW